MGFLLRTVFLLYFSLYALSPLSYVQSDEESPDISPSVNSSVFARLFLLEYLINAHQDQNPSKTSTERLLLHKKNVLTSSGHNKKLFSDKYSVSISFLAPFATVSRAVSAEGNTLVSRPWDIVSRYYTDLSPPSF